MEALENLRLELIGNITDLDGSSSYLCELMKMTYRSVLRRVEEEIEKLSSKSVDK